ncbi:MAG: aminotransferase class I/II-fold pyridoxal phosphate-dependent enzyme [Defluviitaleaceae bacterium]|nr:aminotransferase class I/II-fold pyridoxal phosphate-dependent enzyme [Defluviitaleaceae bacterium]
MRSLYEELAQYVPKRLYPFHMPGHKNNTNFLPQTPLMLLDVTELNNTDNLHDPEDCIKETQNRIATIYGADQSFLLVNGSTTGIVAAIGSICEEKTEMIVARNCHRSVYNGMVLFGVQPIYFHPDKENKGLKEALAKHPQAKSVLVTSPTYEGDVLDIKGIANIVNQHGQNCVLIVDEAHGAHFPFHTIFPKGALSQGADIVVHSFHKTLPAFSQSAAVHVKGNRVNINKLRYYLTCIQTSSPSYLIMSTTDYMLNTLQKNPVYFEEYVERLLKLRKALAGKLLELPGGDIGKLVLAKPLLPTASNQGFSCSLDDVHIWAEEHGLAFEMITNQYILAMTSVADTPQGFSQLEKAFSNTQVKELELLTVGSPLPEIVLSPKEAMNIVMDKKIRKAKLSESIGEVAGSFYAPFPPGIPLLAPGELVTQSIVSYIQDDCEIAVLLL